MSVLAAHGDAFIAAIPGRCLALGPGDDDDDGPVPIGDPPDDDGDDQDDDEDDDDEDDDEEPMQVRRCCIAASPKRAYSGTMSPRRPPARRGPDRPLPDT
jgi:hypothetical protein